MLRWPNQPSLQTNAGYIRLWPSSRAAGPFVLLMHGMESHSDWFKDVAEALQGRGLDVIAWDRPGFGRSSAEAVEVRGHLQSRLQLKLQMQELLATLAELEILPLGHPLHLCGMSWGGLAALHLAGASDLSFASLTLLAPGLSSRVAFPWRDKLAVASSFLLPGTGLEKVKVPLTPDAFAASPEIQHWLAQDPYRTQEVTRRFCVTTLLMMRDVRRATGELPPTLCLLPEADDIVHLVKVKHILRRRQIATQTLPSQKHCLVLEWPDAVAMSMDRHIRASLEQKP